MSALYTLPKEMLIKLLITIQEETEKRCIEKFQKSLNKTKTILNDITTMYNIAIFDCDFCDRYDLHDRYSIFVCDVCNKDCCPLHNKGRFPVIICIECYLNI